MTSLASERFNKLRESNKKDIAIIGMYGKIGECNSINQFWNTLICGKDLIRSISKSRKKDIEEYLKVGDEKQVEDYTYLENAYMTGIDKFDNDLFSITPVEAKTMEPAQRIFLETVWGSIEDAGYGGDKLKGSNTAIYLGYSNIAQKSYIDYIGKMDPSIVDISIPGNIKSIIASRISYILDFKGPSMIIDTACSSSLVAVHQAVRALREGESDYAIAGGVKINFFPVKTSVGDIGVSSKDGRTKTFDRSADGTGMGEGSIAILLKPLDKAMEDKDNIYAVIKGSAINQDGNSIGITAPNPNAQEEVIIKAWADAEIDPETISYIEAHGTGTSLGDPIEIDAIQRAFNKFTSKKQFCGIGSVKTNVGHLDHTSGIAGLVKAVLSLKHKKLPASIHFNAPNKQIDFIDSPVYINDSLEEWKIDSNKRRCGVSSFGMSGTNCHIILEEYHNNQVKVIKDDRKRVLTLSAKNLNGLYQTLFDYNRLLMNFEETDVDSLCFTANTGRGHYNYRIAVIFDSLKELTDKINNLCKTLCFENSSDIYIGYFKIKSSKKSCTKPYEITRNLVKQKTILADKLLDEITGLNSENFYTALKDICDIYIQGGNVKWERIYDNKQRKIPVPIYPFQRQRYWVEKKFEEKEYNLHPLIEESMVKSANIDIYRTFFSLQKHWEAREHVINGKNIIPGTVYVEMAAQLAKIYYKNYPVEMRNLSFSKTLELYKNKQKEVHIITEISKSMLRFKVASKEENDTWNIIAEGEIYALNDIQQKRKNIEEIIGRCEEEISLTMDMLEGGTVKIGPRWKNSRKIYKGDNEILTYIELQDEYKEEIVNYQLHPALLDASVNSGISFVTSKLYLPLYYKELKVYSEIPSKIFSHISWVDKKNQKNETISFDIEILDTDGNVVAEIQDYVVKRVTQDKNSNRTYYHTVWNNSPLNPLNILYLDKLQNKNILVFNGGSSVIDRLRDELVKLNNRVIEVKLGTEYKFNGEDHFVINGLEEDYEKLFIQLSKYNISAIINGFTTSETEPKNIFQLNECMVRGVYGLFYLIKQLTDKKIIKNNLIILSNYANQVIKNQKTINPHNSALFAMAKSIHYEHPSLNIKCIDIDENMEANIILKELTSSNNDFCVAYRDGKRFTEELQPLNIEEAESNNIELYQDGVYIITGGTGGIGLEISKYLSSRERVNLALISRTKFPSNERWNEIIGDKENLLSSKIKLLKSIEESGSKVELISADVSDIKTLSEKIKELRKRHKKIRGIIHCAGVPSQGFTMMKPRDKFDEVIKPKVLGTFALDKLTEEDNLDFFISSSSLTSIIGAIGQADYAAANSFLDTFTAYRNAKGRNTKVINWGGWNETGMALKYGIKEKKSVFKPISSSNGIKAFEKVLFKKVSRVSVVELETKELFNIKDKFLIEISDKVFSKNKKADNKPSYNNIKNEDKRTNDSRSLDVEHQLQMIWKKVLEVKDIDVYDKFFEIGGDSLLATHLLREINKVFEDIIDITDVFTYSTIDEMTKFIREKIKEDKKGSEELEINDDLDLYEILKKVQLKEISLEDAEKII